jgi:transcriptional regulator of heat shock response
LDSPHISAGRIPTEQGLRLFVDGLLEVGDLSSEERKILKSQFRKMKVKSGQCWIRQVRYYLA